MSGAWTVRWRITNESDRPIRLLRAQHPHSQFKTPETNIDRELAAGAATAVALPVRFGESPGAVIENAFLILLLRETEDWRLLARVRVSASPSGEPLAGPSVVVTAQQVGSTGRPPG